MAHMLSDTGEYYSRKASNWILEDSYPGYMSKAEECLKKEGDRVSHYLHSSSEQKLVEKVQNELFLVYATQLLEKEHSALPRDDKHVTAEGTTALVQSAEDATSNQVKNGTILEAISNVGGYFYIQDLRITETVRIEGHKNRPAFIVDEIRKEDGSKCFFLTDTIVVAVSGFDELARKLEVWLQQQMENETEILLQSVAQLAHHLVENVYDDRKRVWHGEKMGLCSIIIAGPERTGGGDLSIYSMKTGSKPEHHTDFVVKSCFAELHNIYMNLYNANEPHVMGKKKNNSGSQL